MIDADKVIARLREKEAEHRRTNRLPYADEYGETADLIEELRTELTALREQSVGVINELFDSIHGVGAHCSIGCFGDDVKMAKTFCEAQRALIKAELKKQTPE